MNTAASDHDLAVSDPAGKTHSTLSRVDLSPRDSRIGRCCGPEGAQRVHRFV